MTITLLQREEAVFDDLTDDDFLEDDLARQAQSLGYHRLYEERQTLHKRRSLRQAFASLDIQPFTDSSVEAYKSACELTPSERVAGSAAVVFFLSLLVILGALPVLVISALFGFATVAFYSAIVFLVNTAIAVPSCWTFVRHSTERKWVLHPLADYTQPVPEFALQTAVDIEKHYPGAELFVCALEESEVVVDPFLVLRTRSGDKHRDYYLEVWNESKFDGQREA